MTRKTLYFCPRPGRSMGANLASLLLLIASLSAVVSTLDLVAAILALVLHSPAGWGGAARDAIHNAFIAGLSWTAREWVLDREALDDRAREATR